MAVYELIFKEGMTPVPDNQIMAALHHLTNRIEIGQKHISGEDRQNNIRVTKGLIRDHLSPQMSRPSVTAPGNGFRF